MKMLLSGLLIASCLLCCKKPSKNDSPPTTCISGNGVTDVEGNKYLTVIIAGKEWMAENLKVSKYNDGTPIPNVADGSQWRLLSSGGWCYLNNELWYNNEFGKLYNWFVISNPKGIAPIGWHIPSDQEWADLIQALGGYKVAGGKLKEQGTARWVNNNPETTNSTCFSARPGGGRDNNINPNLQFGGLGSGTSFWSSTSISSEAYSLALVAQTSETSRGSGPKEYGKNIRCVKN